MNTRKPKEGEWNPRYICYCFAHGNTPQQQYSVDRKRWPGGMMCGFILWNEEMISLFSRMHGKEGFYFVHGNLTTEGHEAYDAWLIGQCYCDSATGMRF